MRACILLLLSVLFSGFSAMAEVDAVLKLRRMSYIIKGIAPSHLENQQLRELSKADQEDYINNKMDEYLNSSDFLGQYRSNINALFGMKSFSETFDSEPKDAFNNLIVKVIKENLSWDKLLTSKEYDISFLSLGGRFDGAGKSDLNFLQAAFREHLKQYLQSGNNSSYESKQDLHQVSAETRNQRENVAGLVTTARFFNRYQTTKVNKNRRRAAALFRIFLCDNMKPVILVDKTNDISILRQTLGLDQAIKKHVSEEQKHGSQKDCMGCHYKLDPMAQTFNGSSAKLSPWPSKGALTFKKKNGELVNVPVTGLGQLGEVITQQKEYTECQVQHFWDWIIGEDVPLSDGKREELVQVFDNAQRRPKDFIKYLISSDDFMNPQTLDVNDIRYSNVRPIFKRCDTCHNQNIAAPKLSNGFPITKNPQWTKFALDQIIYAVDLRESMKEDMMPPANAGWKLDEKERDLLKAWVLNGAKDDSGQPHINAQDLQRLSGSIQMGDSLTRGYLPTMGNTYKRFLSARPLQNSLRKFPPFKVYGYSSSDGLNDSSDFTKLGYPSPLNGNISSIGFSSSALSWMLKEIESNSHNLEMAIFSELFRSYNGYKDQFWGETPDEIKYEVLEEVVDTLVGIENFNQYSSIEELKMNMDKYNSQNVSFSRVIIVLVQKLLIHESFLIY